MDHAAPPAYCYHGPKWIAYVSTFWEQTGNGAWNTQERIQDMIRKVRSLYECRLMIPKCASRTISEQTNPALFANLLTW